MQVGVALAVAPARVLVAVPQAPERVRRRSPRAVVSDKAARAVSRVPVAAQAAVETHSAAMDRVARRGLTARAGRQAAARWEAAVLMAAARGQAAAEHRVAVVAAAVEAVVAAAAAAAGARRDNS
jgi:hypothetical protein